MAKKPDDYDSVRKKFKYQEGGTFDDPPDPPAKVDATTQAIKDQMKLYRDGLFAASASLNRADWWTVFRIVAPVNKKDADRTGAYASISQIHDMSLPDDAHCDPDAQKLKRDLQKHLKQLFQNQNPPWNPKGVAHVIRVAKRTGSSQDDNQCGCGCSAGKPTP